MLARAYQNEAEGAISENVYITMHWELFLFTQIQAFNCSDWLITGGLNETALYESLWLKIRVLELCRVWDNGGLN